MPLIGCRCCQSQCGLKWCHHRDGRLDKPGWKRALVFRPTMDTDWEWNSSKSIRAYNVYRMHRCSPIHRATKSKWVCNHDRYGQPLPLKQPNKWYKSIRITANIDYMLNDILQCYKVIFGSVRPKQDSKEHGIRLVRFWYAIYTIIMYHTFALQSQLFTCCAKFLVLRTNNLMNRKVSTTQMVNVENWRIQRQNNEI